MIANDYLRFSACCILWTFAWACLLRKWSYKVSVRQLFVTVSGYAVIAAVVSERGQIFMVNLSPLPMVPRCLRPEQLCGQWGLRGGEDGPPAAH